MSYSIVKECEGCEHANGPREVGATCGMFERPRAKWTKLGGCEGATHVERKVVADSRVRVGQQKQKKGGR